MNLYYLLENRNFRNQCYSEVRAITRFISNRVLNITSRGLENIPPAPFILAMHHEIGIDGWIIRTQLKEKIHFWLQYENHFNRGWKMPLEAMEEIPIKTEGSKEEIQTSYFQAGNLSKFWLSQGETVGIFTDGPKKNIMDGENLLPLEYRPNFGSAVAISYEPPKKKYYPIIPISFWTPQLYRKQFSKWGKMRTLKNLSFLLKVSFSSEKIPYKIAYGSPLNPRDYSNKSELKEELRNSQIRLYQSLTEN